MGFEVYPMMRFLALILLLTSCAQTPFHGDSGGGADPDSAGVSFQVMAWNIWHGGREDGEEIGVQKTIDVIRNSGADLIAMQETYGSGEIISEALGFHFHPRGTNVSIHSRFPVLADVSVFQEFKCVGAVIELPDGSPLAFYSIWLPYAEDIWLPEIREQCDEARMLAACQVSADDLAKILDLMHAKLHDSGYAEIPVIIAGDFNSMSHLDYTPAAADQYDGWVLNWPTSQVIHDAGFIDSYRQVHPTVNRMRDRTWSPRFTEQEQERIDFIYFRGNLTPTSAEVIQSHADGFPSDHAAVVSKFIK